MSNDKCDRRSAPLKRGIGRAAGLGLGRFFLFLFFFFPRSAGRFAVLRPARPRSQLLRRAGY